MVGIERSGNNTMELRRMIVAAGERWQGGGTTLLQFAEAECRRRGAVRLVLSTSELQPAALALYEGQGFELIRMEVADAPSSKMLGAGLRRFHLGKRLL